MKRRRTNTLATTWIAADDYMTLWAIIVVWAAVSIYLEQKYEWAAKLSGAVIALLGAIALSNTGLIPTESAVYDAVWSYIVPLAIPLLLFHIDFQKVWKESGRLLLMFLLSAMGTAIGTVLAFFALRERIPHLDAIGAMMSGTYTGGSVNLAAMASKFETPGEWVAVSVVADNLMMALYFLLLMAIPALSFFQKRYPHPYVQQVEQAAATTGSETTQAEAYWKRKEISLRDIALSVGTAFFIVALSFKCADFLNVRLPNGEEASFLQNFVHGLLGDRYLLLTTFTFLALLVAPRYFAQLRGSQELGTFLIYLFFVVIGIPASIPLIVQSAPLLLVFVAIIVGTNMIVSLVTGKLFGFKLEEILIASNANIGGPTTAAAMAIAKGWKPLIGPVLVVGTIGYILGNYIGTFLGLWFGTF